MSGVAINSGKDDTESLWSVVYDLVGKYPEVSICKILSN